MSEIMITEIIYLVAVLLAGIISGIYYHFYLKKILPKSPPMQSYIIDKDEECMMQNAMKYFKLVNK